jgi:hypothetical protein
MAKMKMSAGLCLAALTVALLAPAAYADFNMRNYQFAPDAYQDLPGVKDPKDLAKLPDPYRCETTLLHTRNPHGVYRDVFGARGLPTTGYKCTTEDGQVYYGTVHPKARNQHPQIEPYSPL